MGAVGPVRMHAHGNQGSGVACDRLNATQQPPRQHRRRSQSHGAHTKHFYQHNAAQAWLWKRDGVHPKVRGGNRGVIGGCQAPRTPTSSGSNGDWVSFAMRSSPLSIVFLHAESLQDARPVVARSTLNLVDIDGGRGWAVPGQVSEVEVRMCIDDLSGVVGEWHVSIVAFSKRVESQSRCASAA